MPSYFKIIQCVTKLQSGHECVYLFTLNCNNVKFQNDSVTLTFEVGTWFLNATHHLDVVDICAKLFHNPSIYDKVTVLTQIKWGRTDEQMDGQTVRLYYASLWGHKNQLKEVYNYYRTCIYLSRICVIFTTATYSQWITLKAVKETFQ
jgi:hypothetical protein